MYPRDSKRNARYFLLFMPLDSQQTLDINFIWLIDDWRYPDSSSFLRIERIFYRAELEADLAAYCTTASNPPFICPPHSVYRKINVYDCSLQRRRGIWRHLSDERRREEQWDLLVRAARYIQEHLQDRHYLVPLWRSTLRDEIRLLDVRRFSGEDERYGIRSADRRRFPVHNAARYPHLVEFSNLSQARRYFSLVRFGTRK
jgi:hypothetical protein